MEKPHKEILLLMLCGMSVLYFGCTTICSDPPEENCNVKQEETSKIIISPLNGKEIKLSFRINDTETSVVVNKGKEATVLSHSPDVTPPFYSGLLYCLVEEKDKKYFVKIIYKSKSSKNIFFYNGILNEGCNTL